MKKTLQRLQLLDAEGSLRLHLLLLFVWSVKVLVSQQLTVLDAVIGLMFLLNHQAERYFKSRDQNQMAEREQKRLDKLEADLMTINAMMQLGSQRTML